MKTAFLIAGFNMNQSATDDKYNELRKAITSHGYRVVPVPFVWNHTTVPQYVDKFMDFYSKNKGSYSIVIGNSYGAMVAFLSAPIITPDEIYLCSLSPFFKEDKQRTTQSYRLKKFGKRRNQAMEILSADQTAKAINQTKTKVIMLYGEKEKVDVPYLVERVLETSRSLRNIELIEIPDAPHSFRDPSYIKGIDLSLSK